MNGHSPVKITRLLFLCLILLLTMPLALAQGERGAFNGIVTDQTGAIVPGAEIVAANRDTGVETKRNNRELTRTADAKGLVNLSSLLLTDDDDSICSQPRQDSLYQQKQSRLKRAVVAVKNMAMVSMHEPAASRPPQKHRGRRPAIEQSGNSPNRAGFSGVRVHYVWVFA